MPSIVIDSGLAALCPPLAPEEYDGLENSILAEGCRDALIVWGDILLDGHNRKRICDEHRIAYRTEAVVLTDRLAAEIWVLRNQSARRNLTDDQRAIKAAELAEKLSEEAKRERAIRANDVRWGNETESSSLETDAVSKDEGAKGRSRSQAAKGARVSERKVHQAQTVRAKAPEMVPLVVSGEISLADAVREVKRAEQVAQLEDIGAKAAKAVEGVYDVVVIDPPWPMQKIERDERANQAEMPYPIMGLEEIAALPIPCADDCHVWLWTTHKFLPAALSLLEGWGLRYVCTFVWHKPGGFQPIGLPQYNCEFAIYARRGSPIFVDTKAFPACFEAARGAHSEKPAAFYETVRRVTAGRRLDMFSRREIDGFDSWGNEATNGV